MRFLALSLCVTASALAAAACSDAATVAKSDAGAASDAGTPPATSDASTPASTPTPLPMNAQTPPQTGAADVEAWLAKGDYKSWHCETAPHESRSPSPHSWNRICSNDLVASFTGSGERPKGSAGVKELYDEGGKNITGYAVYVKSADASGGGASWYWYERVPMDSAAPHDAKGVVADGFGGAGTPKSICVGCHAAAGSDAAHTPTAGGSDQVYTPVR